MRFASADEQKAFNGLLVKNPDGGSIFQSPTFLQVKQLQGWQLRLIISDNGIAFTALERRIPLFGKVWYILGGPGVTEVESLRLFVDELFAFGASQKVVFIKLDPQVIKDADTHMDKVPRLLKSPDIQFNTNTIVMDLSRSLDDIFASLNQKGRNAIRRAEREGLRVESADGSEDSFAKMYKLLGETAAGAGFSLKHQEYYHTYWSDLCRAGLGKFFFAYHDQEVVAAAFAMILGKNSVYKDGASVRNRPVYGASHLLQWHVIQWAKSAGSTRHDLCGAPPEHERENAKHPLYGIGLFKSQFEKRITEYVGSYDLPIKPVRYKLWHLGLEKLVRKAYFMTHHQSFY